VTVLPPGRLLVVGDSVGQKLGPGFQHEAPADLKVVDGGMAFCGAGEAWPQLTLAGHRFKDPCADWRKRWTSQAAKMHADGVMIVFGAYTETRLIDGAYRESCDPVYDAWLQSAFTDVVTTMEAFGPVWLVLPPYDRVYKTGRSLEDCDMHTDCTTRDFRAAVSAAPPGVAVIDLRAFVCPNAPTCVEEVNGVRLRPDGLHFEGPGADIVARWLLAQIGVHFDDGG